MKDRAELMEHAQRLRYLELAQHARALMDIADESRRHLGWATLANVTTAVLGRLGYLPTHAMWGVLTMWGYFFGAAVWHQHVAHRAIAQMAECGSEGE